jgi:6-phosphogluconolactonase
VALRSRYAVIARQPHRISSIKPLQNQILIFEVDPNSGALVTTLSPVASAQSPSGIVVTSNNFLYVSENWGTETLVYAYLVNTSDGELTPVAGSPFDTGIAEFAWGVAVDPGGRFLYVTAGASQVAALAIAADGSLTPIVGSPFDTGDATPVAATVDPSGHYLYVSNEGSAQGSVSAFSIDSATGSLTPIPGSPFATVANGGPIQLATDLQGTHLYVPLCNGGVFGFDIESTGALTPMPASPFAISADTNEVTVDPARNFLFVGFPGGVDTVSIDPSTGDLALLTVTNGNGAGLPAMAMNSLGTLLFVNTSTQILISTVSSTGNLTPVPPLNGGANPAGLVIIDSTP